MTTTPPTDSGYTPEDLTAFALGELNPASDTHRAIADALSQDPAIRDEIDAIKRSGNTVREALAHEPAGTSTVGAGVPPALGHTGRRDARPAETKPGRTTPRQPLFARPALLAAGFALAAGAAVTVVTLMHNTSGGPHPTHAAPTPRGIDTIHAALDTPVTRSFKAVPLGDVFAAVSDATHAELAVDWPALEARGVTRDTTLTFDADAVPARDLLSLALAACWQELPHPDPVVWTVTPDEVRIEPRSAAVQRSLDQAQRVLAAANTTNTRLSQRQLALVDAPGWQQPATVTDAIRAEQQAFLAAYEAQQAELARIEFERSEEGRRLAEERARMSREKVAEADTMIDEGRLAQAAMLYEEALQLTPGAAGLPAKLAGARAQLWHRQHPADPLIVTSDEIALMRNDAVRHVELAVARTGTLATRNNSTSDIDQAHAVLETLGEAEELVLSNRTFFSEAERADLERRLAESQAELITVVARITNLNSAHAQTIDTARADPVSEREIVRRLSERVPPTGTTNLRYLSTDGQQGQQLPARAPRTTTAVTGEGLEIRGYYDGIGGLRGRGEQVDSLGRSTRGVQAGTEFYSFSDLGLSAPDDTAEVDRFAAPVAGVVVESRTRDAAPRMRLEADGIMPPDNLYVPEDAELGERLRTRQQQQAQAQQELARLLAPPYDPHLNRDTYALVNDNPFHTGFNDPLSTFSVDVDTAAYSIVRRQVVQQGQVPVPGAVRIEELVNYFEYGYAAPEVDPAMLDSGVVTRASLERLAGDDESFAPFATHIEVTDCPWADGHQLVRIGIKGMEVQQQDRPTAHLTFLLDVSGSMSSENKLPLVKRSMRMLLTRLNADDRVSIVVYAGAAGVVLENASAADVPTIEQALEKLSAGGSTAGGEGIQLAYDIAERHYVDGGVNRVILCTDGDFNVGISDRDQLVELIKDRANPEPDEAGAMRGVYLSVLGFGFGNLNDNMMEPLTNAGNGNYAYIDTLAEAEKVMVDQVGGTLVTIAKDVKVQVEFNPARVLAYRLIGYENRILAAEDFADDTVDAGDIGAGHTVTALYEVVPFPEDDGMDDEEVLREVKLRIEELDAALAFSASVLENTPLTEEQYRKLAGSVRLMQQQRAVASAMLDTAKRRPVSAALGGTGDDPAGIDLRYRLGTEIVEADDELMVVNLRYKAVDAPAEQGTSRLIRTVVGVDAMPFAEADDDTRFAVAVAGYGMVLRNSPHRGDADLEWVLDTAGDALGRDRHGYRAGFVSLVERTTQTMPEPDAEKEPNAIAPVDGRRPWRGR